MSFCINLVLEVYFDASTSTYLSKSKRYIEDLSASSYTANENKYCFPSSYWHLLQHTHAIATLCGYLTHNFFFFPPILSLTPDPAAFPSTHCTTLHFTRPSWSFSRRHFPPLMWYLYSVVNSIACSEWCAAASEIAHQERRAVCSAAQQ